MVRSLSPSVHVLKVFVQIDLKSPRSFKSVACGFPTLSGLFQDTGRALSASSLEEGELLTLIGSLPKDPPERRCLAGLDTQELSYLVT